MMLLHKVTRLTGRISQTCNECSRRQRSLGRDDPSMQDAAAFWRAKQEPTQLKHVLLEKYIRAWGTIIAKHFSRAVYVDAFAGRGLFDNGEPGSPLIVQNALEEVRRKNKKSRCAFEVYAIEADEQHFDCLNKALKPREYVTTACCLGQFGSSLEWLLEKCSTDPSFIFLDPHGWVGVDYRYIVPLAALERAEILIFFAFNEIQRFLTAPKQRSNMQKLFGTRDFLKIGQSSWNHGKAREREIVNLYRSQLKSLGFYVIPIPISKANADRTSFYLFYAARLPLAAGIMKDILLDTIEKNRQTSLFEGSYGFVAMRDLPAGGLKEAVLEGYPRERWIHVSRLYGELVEKYEPVRKSDVLRLLREDLVPRGLAKTDPPNARNLERARVVFLSPF